MDVSSPPPAEHTLRLALAQKLLHAWSQNRQQVRVPLALNLTRLPPDHRRLLVGVMGASLAACGVTAEADRARLAAALARLGAEGDETGTPDLIPLLAALEQAELGPHAFAAAALVMDGRVPAQRLFLAWLAARFGLPPSLVSGLARRYRA
jgi:uncharacterized membrane protein YebE (DUF533 family)